jgi:hypothetical protein
MQVDGHLVVPESLAQLGDVHVLKRRRAGLGKRVVCVLIVAVGETLVADVVSIGRHEHANAAIVGDVQFVLPAVLDQK